MRILAGLRGTRNLTPEQRKEQSERAKKTIRRVQPQWFGRIGRVENAIQDALFAAHGDPVSTRHLALWVYYGARWDTGRWRAHDDEPLPDPHTRYPTYPSEHIWRKDADGNEVLEKPKIERWQLRTIRRAAQAFGTCVGKSKNGVWMWVLRTGPNGEIFHFDVRAEKTKRSMANKAKRAKAEGRQRKRYGKA
jgi:hypothetical protein